MCCYLAAVLSFHQTQDHFEGPQNKKHYAHWQWAMEAMTTYGPARSKLAIEMFSAESDTIMTMADTRLPPKLSASWIIMIKNVGRHRCRSLSSGSTSGASAGSGPIR